MGINTPLTEKRIITGLEIEGGYLKLAQARDVKGARRIVKLIVRKLPSQSEEDIVTALSDVRSQVKEGLGRLVISIPRHKLTVRFLRFPTTSEKEIKGMVELQLTKELPFPKEDLSSDYLITERTKDGYAKVALAIAQRGVVENYLNILKRAHFEPERITFSAEAILGWCEAAFKQDRPNGYSILIDPDCDNTEILLLHNSQLVFARGLNWGTVQMMTQADLKNKLAEEIRRTIEGYSRQDPHREIERIFLSQPGKMIEGLKEFLEQEFKLPCLVLAPLKGLTYERGVSGVQYKPELSLLRVLGMVVGLSKKKINLLPLNLRRKQEIKLKRKKLYVSLVLSAFIILASGLIFAKKIHVKQLHISYLNREIEKTAPEAQNVEAMLKNIELIEARSKIEGSSVDALRELHNILPKDILLSNLDYDEGAGALRLRGISKNIPDIFSFIEALEASSCFKNVQLKYVSEKKLKASGFADFKIECALEE
ncbi:MAG: pilus assembly protein PilM [Candidatus Omnitrophota bacterium]|nr:MAG: pilus assembly protein PilM [Candidatus Omnitrophota bacterium]